jgi:hypothetical protein
MWNNPVARKVGLSIGAAFAVPYTLLVLGSVFLIGLLTSGSWQALLLGLEWQTLVGFELGLLVLTATGLAVAGLGVAVIRLVRRRSYTDPRAPFVPDRSIALSSSGACRLLAVCALLPAVIFPVLHTVASLLPAPVASGRGNESAQAATVRPQPVNLGSPINTAYREAEPSFTADGRTMYFNCRNGDICTSRLTGTGDQASWSTPELLSAPINTEYEEVEPVVSGSGDTLYFTSIRPIGFWKGVPFLSPFVDVLEIVNRVVTGGGGQPLLGGMGLDDIWISRRSNGAWSEPESINSVAGAPAVNTSYADHCLFFSADGNEAFWTSTRPGGYGADDIWTSRRVGGEWSAPENLGPNVNGPGVEHTSIPTPDGHSLYVTTDRPGGFGGEDIYVARRGADGVWGPLVNLGEPINGPGDDRCPAWTPDLTIFLFDSIRPNGRGARDIWWIDFKYVKGYPSSQAAGAVPGP